jgi:hypothetical protein
MLRHNSIVIFYIFTKTKMSEIYKSYETTELDASLKNDLKRLQDNIKNNKLIDDKADKIRQRER